MGKRKIKILTSLAVALAVLSQTVMVYAVSGDIGYFGGITQGRRLPKATEILLRSTDVTDMTSFNYKEVIFLTGNPEVFEGTLTVTPRGVATNPVNLVGVDPTNLVGRRRAQATNGTYNVNYAVNGTSPTGARIARNITFRVNWRIEGMQIIKDLTATNWTETITPGVGSAMTGGNAPDYFVPTYTLDRDSFTSGQSFFNVSIIEDHTAAVTYYRGDISQRTVYLTNIAQNAQAPAAGTAPSATATTDTDPIYDNITGNNANANRNAAARTGNQIVINDVYGSFYGCDSAWSSTETHRLDGTVYAKSRLQGTANLADIWQYQYQVRPSVSVNKTLQYTQNEPNLISFEGNYKEVMANESGLFYDLFVMPQQLFDVPQSGNAAIASQNVFEQLIAPDLAFLKGHPAESDINRLFAMQILEGNPRYYVPNQAITRQQFTAAVIRALRIPLVEVTRNTRARPLLYPDVPVNSPDYQLITTAYAAGIAIGRSNGLFEADAPIERQEALVILLRSLGLENLGLDPTPVFNPNPVFDPLPAVFADDAQISAWARRELAAAARIGLILPDANGNINPRAQVSKAEAAALINALIDYMRFALPLDYARIVNETT